MRRQIIATSFIGALAISAVSCGGDSTATSTDTESGTSEVVLPLTGVWTQASTADAPIAATSEFCCSTAIPDSPEFTADAQPLADGMYAMHIAHWFSDVQASVIDMSILRYRSCADPFMVSSDLNECTGVVGDLASATDLSLENHRDLDLTSNDITIWLFGHACLTDGVDITSWVGDGLALTNLMQSFQSDKEQWLDPYVQGELRWVQDLSPEATAGDSPFVISSCVENALEWTIPDGPTLLIQGSIDDVGPGAAVTQWVAGRSLEISAGQQTAYLYGAYRP